MSSEKLPSQNPVLEAILSRRSIRGFLNTEVPPAILRDILSASARAPSATNTQPWKVHVVSGAAKNKLTEAILQERRLSEIEPDPEYKYYPDSWPEPYRQRRREVGFALYKLLGIPKGDRSASRRWHDENFRFFGAPVGMIFTVDKSLAIGSIMDVAMFMQNIAIAARSFALDTCPQAAFANYHAAIRTQLNLADEEMVIAGMAIGYADHEFIANQLTTTRETIDHFTVFHS